MEPRNLSSPAFFSPDQTRSQLDEKLQQSSNTFIFKPLPVRGGYTQFYRALFKYPSLLFRLLWVLPLCNYAELWPKEQVPTRDCGQQCNAPPSLNMAY